MMYRALVHWRLHQALVREARQMIGPLGRVISKLQFGYWDGGTRVKKLRGFGRPVYEARLDDGARAVFTVAHSASNEPPHELTPHILVWDVRTHDRVNQARRLNFSPEAAFVDFPVEEEHETTEPAEALGGADEVREAVRWLALDPEWVVDDARWQVLFDEGVPGFELKLTREQYTVLHTRGPVLVSGAAGSGKSTLSVHWLAGHLAHTPAPRALYITYSAALLEQMRGWLEELLHARGLAPEPAPEMITFPELYQKLAGTAAGPLVRFERFAGWYSAQARRNDAALAWEELRGIIKGACLDTERAMLSRDEYEELGRKRAPLFCAERPRLYQVARKYQEWLRAEGLSDDIDVARRALAAVRQRRLAGYAVVVCDEAQDLTELEVSLLLEVCRDPMCAGLLVTGDPQQVVNPSGFRWGEVRSLLRARLKPYGVAPPEPVRLTQNFRSARGIVALANALLGVQRARTGRCDDDTAEEAHTHGPAPVLVNATRGEALARLQDIGPRVAVIAPDARTVAGLQAQLKTTRVFDVPGAKGLEFERVVLWGMLGGEADMWRELLVGTAWLRENAAARRAVRQCYVGVTRARRWLAIWEEEAVRDLWLAPALRGVIEQDTDAALQQFGAEAASPGEWEEQAQYYLARGRYRQAEECFRRAGNLAAARRAEAEAVAAAGEAVRAAELFVELGEHERAIALLAGAREEERAAQVCEQLGREGEARLLRLAAWERAGNWRAVGEARAAQREWELAAEAYERAGCTAQARQCRIEQHVAAEAWCEAARVYEQSGAWERAAEMYERGGDAERAAHARARAAATAQPAAPPKEPPGDFRARARRHEQHDDLARAIKALAHGKDAYSRAKMAALQAEVAGDFVEAARQHYSLGEWQAVLRAVGKNDRQYARTGTMKLEVVEEIRGLGARAAVRKLMDEQDYRGALEELKLQEIWLPEDEYHLLRAQIEERLRRHVAAVRTMLRVGMHKEAREIAQRAPQRARLEAMIEADEAEYGGRFQDAARLWQAAGCTKDARRCHARIARAGQSASMPLELSQAEQRRKTMCEWALAHPLCTRAEISAGIGVPMPSLVNDWPYMKLNQEMAYGTYDRRYYYAARAWCAEHGIAVDEYGEMDRRSLHAVLQRRAAEAPAPAPVAAQGAGAATSPTQPELFA